MSRKLVTAPQEVTRTFRAILSAPRDKLIVERNRVFWQICAGTVEKATGVIWDAVTDVTSYYRDSVCVHEIKGRYAFEAALLALNLPTPDMKKGAPRREKD